VCVCFPVLCAWMHICDRYVRGLSWKHGKHTLLHVCILHGEKEEQRNDCIYWDHNYFFDARSTLPLYVCMHACMLQGRADDLLVPGRGIRRFSYTNSARWLFLCNVVLKCQIIHSTPFINTIRQGPGHSVSQQSEARDSKHVTVSTLQ
jgi:hypothetical protein